MAKKCQLLGQTSVFWVCMVSWFSPYPSLRVLNLEKMCCMPLNSFNKCFRAANTKKKHNFWPKDGKKMPIFTLNQSFLGLNGHTLF